MLSTKSKFNWMGFKGEALQRPCSALLDLQGDRWQGNDPSQVGEVSLVAKAGQVALDPIMPGDQRGGTSEADGAVGSDQRSAGKSGEGLHHE